MLRINLLPREVLDRHRFQGWYRYIFIISTGLVLVVLLVSALLYMLVVQKSEELTSTREKTQSYIEQGKAFDVFEKKEKEFTDRQAVVQTALSGRMNLGKVAEEISLVLPDEVWLDSLSLGQDTGVSFIGNTPRTSSHSMSIAYKSVAKTLVRLNELPDVADVWLSNASNLTWSNWDPTSGIETVTPVVQFTASAKVIKAATTTTTVGK